MYIRRLIAGFGFATLMLQASQVNQLALKADVVVVAKASSITSNPLGVSITLEIERVLKGSQIGSTIQAAAPDRSLVGQFERSCGIWFLQQQDGKLNVIPVERSSPLGALRMTASCSVPQSYSYSPQANVVDKTLSEIAESAELLEGKRYQAMRLFTALRGSGSPLEAQVMQRLITSQSLELRAVALGLQIAQGNVAGLNRAELEIPNVRSSAALVIYLTALSDFSAPAGVPSLGRLATNSSNELAVRRAAARALKTIHSVPALNFLHILLDHSDKEIRENAVSGFSLFRLGIPPGLKGAAFDRALLAAADPAGKLSSSSDREGIHLGKFADEAEESALINFYKAWWPKNAGRFGNAQ
jgi:HEAT repeat protein